MSPNGFVISDGVSWSGDAKSGASLINAFAAVVNAAAAALGRAWVFVLGKRLG